MQKLCILVFVACATGAAAQAQESGTEAEDRNFIELFVGITNDDGENDPSLGLTYEHRFGGSVPGLSQNSLRPTAERPCLPCRFSGTRQIHGAP